MNPSGSIRWEFVRRSLRRRMKGFDMKTLRQLIEDTMARTAEGLVVATNTVRNGWLIASSTGDVKLS